MTESNTITNGDVLEVLKGWPNGYCDMAITSPPYWRLRSYLHKDHPDKAKELGSEPTIEEYIQKQVEVFREVRRVVKDWGTLWLNMGDSYSTNPGNGRGGEKCDGGIPHRSGLDKTNSGLKEKDLCGVPWRMALALQADGWYLRDDIIWVKAWSFHDCGAEQPIEVVEQGLWGEEYRQTIEPDEKNYVGSTMPESVSGWRWTRHRIKIKPRGTTGNAAYSSEFGRPKHSGNIVLDTALWQDCPGCPKCEANGGYVLRKGAGRPTKAHEHLFLFSKSPAYYYDNEAVKEDINWNDRYNRKWNVEKKDSPDGIARARCQGCGDYLITPDRKRNLRDCWCINPQSFDHKQYGKGHYATFPEKLVEPCIKAGTSERGNCPKCGMPWARIIGEPSGGSIGKSWGNHDQDAVAGNAKLESSKGYMSGGTLGWKASCNCNAGEPVPAVVLDCYAGTNTTGLVAHKLGRNWAGIELNPEYIKIAERRMEKEKGLI